MDALVDQDAQKSTVPGLTGGIPGLPLGGGAVPGLGSSIPPPPIVPGVGAGSAVPPLPPPPPFAIPGFNGAPPPPLPGLDLHNPPDPAKLLELMQQAGMPMPPPGSLPPGLIPPPGGMPPLPGNFPLPIPPPMNPNDSDRRRIPLPSQEESLRQEQRHGKYTRAR